MQKILDVKTVSLTIKLKILMLIVKKIRSFTPKDRTFYPKRSDLLHTPLPSFQIYLKLYNHHLLYFKATSKNCFASDLRIFIRKISSFFFNRIARYDRSKESRNLLKNVAIKQVKSNA